MYILLVASRTSRTYQQLVVVVRKPFYAKLHTYMYQYVLEVVCIMYVVYVVATRSFYYIVYYEYEYYAYSFFVIIGYQIYILLYIRRWNVTYTRLILLHRGWLVVIFTKRKKISSFWLRRRTAICPQVIKFSLQFFQFSFVQQL